MEEGFTLDHSSGESLAAEWVEGPAEKSFWTGRQDAWPRSPADRDDRCELRLPRSYAR